MYEIYMGVKTDKEQNFLCKLDGNKIMNITQQAKQILIHAYGKEALFREGQIEAIEATLVKKRLLVVQKTGWGKSLIYFITTKIIRQNKGGATIIISPLLELMNNQVETASLFQLKCEILNSTVKDETERVRILKDLQTGVTDVFFTTPETLFREEVQAAIINVNLGLFVIDEAHCLSDWGHDFRREYNRLYRVIDLLPSTVPVLCTTATANDRVINDLAKHLGGDIFISRGDLMRESLYLQVVNLQNKAERYAWILDHINELPGTGIIYCLTKRECDYLYRFLKQNNISADIYYSDNNRENTGFNANAIDNFKHNKIKVIIATIKLGMGYDKPDIGFVIHYQRPQNIVSYYQQIGRAGRNIKKAYAVLMSGSEDEDILNYFIENAFPSEEMSNRVLQAADGKSKNELYAIINGRKSRINNAIDFLESDGYLHKERAKYYRVPKIFHYNRKHYDEITSIRRHEMEQMRVLTTTKECLLRFTVRNLNNLVETDCGRCENCTGDPMLPHSYSIESLHIAQEFINRLIIVIEPRKQWATTDKTRQTKIPYPLQQGLCLSKYGDIGYGEMVKHDKYKANEYRDELLVVSIKKLNEVVKEKDIKMLAYVPSLRNDKMKLFADKLAKGLGLYFLDVIIKSEAPQQKTMENSSFQCINALNSFSIQSDFPILGNVLLVDDIVDSRWTLTVCGNLLGEFGCGVVIPFCLADSSEGGGDDE
jgi:ATP-dependent DNA helicase RecQ